MASAAGIRAGDAFVELFLKQDGFDRGLDAVHAKMQALGESVATFGGRMTALGGVMTAPFAAALAIFTGFDDKMARVRAVTKASGDEFAALESKARELGRTTAFTAAQAAQGMVHLAQAGQNTRQILASLPAVLDLARAGAMDLGAAASVAADIGTAFKLSANEIDRVADVLATAANISNTDVAPMADAFQYMAATASNTSQSLEEVSAAMAVLANQSIKGSMAGTGLRQVMSSLVKPKTVAWLKDMGVSVADAGGRMRPLLDIMRDMSAGMAGMGEIQRTADYFEMFGDRGGAAAQILANAGSNVDRFREALANCAGEAKRVGEDMEDSLGGALRLARSALEDVAIEVAKALKPLVTDGLALATTFLNLAQSVLQVAPGLTVAAAVAAGLTLAFGVLVLAVGKAIQTGAWLTEAFSRTGRAARGVVDHLTGKTKATQEAAAADAEAKAKAAEHEAALLELAKAEREAQEAAEAASAAKQTRMAAEAKEAEKNADAVRQAEEEVRKARSGAHGRAVEEVNNAQHAERLRLERELDRAAQDRRNREKAARATTRELQRAEEALGDAQERRYAAVMRLASAEEKAKETGKGNAKVMRELKAAATEATRAQEELNQAQSRIRNLDKRKDREGKGTRDALARENQLRDRRDALDAGRHQAIAARMKRPDPGIEAAEKKLADLRIRLVNQTGDAVRNAMVREASSRLRATEAAIGLANAEDQVARAATAAGAAQQKAGTLAATASGQHGRLSAALGRGVVSAFNMRRAGQYLSSVLRRTGQEAEWLGGAFRRVAQPVVNTALRGYATSADYLGHAFQRLMVKTEGVRGKLAGMAGAFMGASGAITMAAGAVAGFAGDSTVGKVAGYTAQVSGLAMTFQMLTTSLGMTAGGVALLAAKGAVLAATFYAVYKAAGYFYEQLNPGIAEIRKTVEETERLNKEIATANDRLLKMHQTDPLTLDQAAKDVNEWVKGMEAAGKSAEEINDALRETVKIQNELVKRKLSDVTTNNNTPLKPSDIEPTHWLLKTAPALWATDQGSKWIKNKFLPDYLGPTTNMTQEELDAANAEAQAKGQAASNVLLARGVDTSGVETTEGQQAAAKGLLTSWKRLTDLTGDRSVKDREEAVAADFTDAMKQDPKSALARADGNVAVLREEERKVLAELERRRQEVEALLASGKFMGEGEQAALEAEVKQLDERFRGIFRMLDFWKRFQEEAKRAVASAERDLERMGEKAKEAEERLAKEKEQVISRIRDGQLTEDRVAAKKDLENVGRQNPEAAREAAQSMIADLERQFRQAVADGEAAYQRGDMEGLRQADARMSITRDNLEAVRNSGIAETNERESRFNASWSAQALEAMLRGGGGNSLQDRQMRMGEEIKKAVKDDIVRLLGQLLRKEPSVAAERRG